MIYLYNMETLTHKLILEGKYSGNIITTNLPQELDNALYTLIHFVGGMDFADINYFAHNATEEELRLLNHLVNQFPNTIQEIMPLAGSYTVLRKSPEYQQIINLVKGVEKNFHLDEGLNDLVYRDTPKEKHIKRMGKGWGPLTGFPIEKFQNTPPPENESQTTEEEIEHLDNIPVDEKFIELGDDIDKPFKKFLQSKDLEYPLEPIKKVMGGIRSIILQLKYYYNRPRPGQVADAKGIDFDPEFLKSASTPSYPSGHATQGKFIARYLSNLYPEYEKEFMMLGDDIAYSRNMAKVHYPSDSAFGKELGDALYDYVHEPQMETELAEHVSLGADGFPTTGTNPYFTRYFNPKFKEKLFKHWDSLGAPDYDSLKLFGVEDSSGMPDYTDFRNVSDIIYPILALEWVGGFENTTFAKAGWDTTSEGGWYKLHFKVEPVGYDYMFDESENFGEHGYACWHIRILIDKDGDFDPADEREDSEIPYIQELFPESARNKLSSFNNYTNEQFEVIELLWDYYHAEASQYWSQFCQVEVVLV